MSIETEFLKPFIAIKISLVCVFGRLKGCRGGHDDIDPRHGSLSTAQILVTVKMFFEPVAGDYWITLRLL
jgi:hypothetical protein